MLDELESTPSYLWALAEEVARKAGDALTAERLAKGAAALIDALKGGG